MNDIREQLTVTFGQMMIGQGYPTVGELVDAAIDQVSAALDTLERGA